jgi:hypothetical protein
MIPCRSNYGNVIDPKQPDPRCAPGIQMDVPYTYRHVFFGCTLEDPEQQPWEPARKRRVRRSHRSQATGHAHSQVQ